MSEHDGYNPTIHHGVSRIDENTSIFWNKARHVAPEAFADAAPAQLIDMAEKATSKLVEFALSYIEGRRRGPKMISRASLVRAQREVLAGLRVEFGVPESPEETRS